MIYLASPYTHIDINVRNKRFKQMCGIAGHLLNKGLFVYSPIVHGHPIAEHTTGLPTDFGFWKAYNHETIDSCHAVWVVMLDGWEKSSGVEDEIKYAHETGKTCEFLDPLTLTIVPAPRKH